MIPRILHRVWFGDTIPELADIYWLRWRELYPDWGLVTWHDPWPLLRGVATDDDIARMKYADLRAPSNIARLALLLRCGGVYVDCDMEPLTSGLDTIIEADSTSFVGETADRIYNNAIVGAEPGDWWLHEILQAIQRALVTEGGYNADRHSEQTGPYLLTQHTQRNMIRVFDPEMFYPIPWNGPGQITPRSITNHHWWSAPR
jgi:mannosyltransferase OCH1-like enzyme